jgi:two-component SAPR family response regulator
MRIKFYAILSLLLIVASFPVSAQSYGLGFVGHEVVQDKRTSLDLSFEKPICFDHNFELSFDLSFMPGYTDYFGYIFRLVDKEKRNIDLIYDMRFQENKHFKLIAGDKISDISFDIDIHKLFKNWYNIKLHFNVDRQELVLQVDGKTYRQKISLKSECYKLLIGANNYMDFKVKDIPPMKIRDIKIAENGKISYHWPLNEMSGLKASESVRGDAGNVTNPMWIRKMHHDWQLVKAFEVNGAASVALNSKNEQLYVIAEDSLATYNVGSQTLSFQRYSSGKQQLLSGNQSVYDVNTDKLLNFYMDQKLVSIFNFSDHSWDKKYIYPDVITLFWHPNKFYAAADSSLYMIGGYGQYVYRRSVHKYHFSDQKWSISEPKGDFMPRYLSALGGVKNGVYILGGYGSSTGEQILNAKNIYDLNFYDFKKNVFKKILELKPKNEEFAFANSMVINEKTGSYYALTFPNYKYNSSLQLIRGALNSPAYNLMGNSIPYAFHDIHSFADLYFCPASNRFVAVLLLHDEKKNKTSVKVYTLYGPPEAYVADQSKESSSVTNKYFWLILCLLLAIVVFVVHRWRKNKVRKKEIGTITAEQVVKVDEVTGGDLDPVLPQGKEPVKNAIFLFGNLQLFDKDGEDITKSLSPLIRELFLVVLLYTIKGRGISTEKLTEVLWFDKSVESARNNRSVSIAKLKLILERMDGCQISKNTGYWMIDFNQNNVKVDYQQYLDIVNGEGEIDKQSLTKLTKIVHRGGFLSNLEFDWLDSFKSEISNEIIDTYLHYAATVNPTDDPEFLISIADSISYFDPVNEEAMIIKCKALVHLGKHSLAKAKFETFNKDYKVIYGEEFKKSFQEVLG